MQNEREKHLNNLKQSLQQKPGSQELHSALCHPSMALQSHNQIYFFLALLILRRLSHEQVASQHEI